MPNAFVAWFSYSCHSCQIFVVKNKKVAKLNPRSPVEKVGHLQNHKIVRIPFSPQQFLVASRKKASNTGIEEHLVRNTLIMEKVQHFTPLTHLI